MNILGYIVALGNLQTFGNPGEQLKDISIKLESVGSLAEELKNYLDFDLEAARENGVTRVGNVEIYLSKPLRNFLFNKNVSPGTEGALITLYYRSPDENNQENDDPSYTRYLAHREGLKYNEVEQLEALYG